MYDLLVAAALAATFHSVWYDLQALWSEWVIADDDDVVQRYEDHARGYLVFAYLFGLMAVTGTL